MSRWGSGRVCGQYGHSSMACCAWASEKSPNHSHCRSHTRYCSCRLVACQELLIQVHACGLPDGLRHGTKVGKQVDASHGPTFFQQRPSKRTATIENATRRKRTTSRRSHRQDPDTSPNNPDKSFNTDKMGGVTVKDVEVCDRVEPSQSATTAH